MKKITLYNTLTKSKELFEPINKGVVSLYSCGPTVYWDPHIGNMRAYMFVDLLKKVLIEVGWYSVNHIMNITDVGHLTDDGDHGEDKMEKGARREKKTVREVARAYEANFKKYSKELNISAPNEYTRATEYMDEQIAMIQSLIDKWFTYVIPWDGIYMDTSKIESYGKLAQLDFDWMNSEHRVDWAKIDSSKKLNLSDFALRKFSPDDSERAMQWVFEGEFSWSLLVKDDFILSDFLQESEYCKQLKTITINDVRESDKASIWFPWWHIECSAMATAELGTHIDIHTWWVDHIPVHHTNEIAQAECSLWCKQRVNWRMHGQFLNINWSKVSKSKWDDLSIPWIIQRWYDPLDLRYFYFTGHYRSFLDFTWEALTAAQTSRKNLIKKLSKHLPESINLANLTWWSLYQELIWHLADDLDIVSVFSRIYSWLDSKESCLDILLLDAQVLHLWLLDAIHQLNTSNNLEAPQEIVSLAQQRIVAKNEKNYEEADRLREEITAAWRELKDNADGFTLSPL